MRKHLELKHSPFHDTAHHLGTFKAVPMGSSEWAGKFPAKRGALQLQSTPTVLSWVTSAPLHYTLQRQGRGKGVAAAMKEGLISAFWYLSQDAEALPVWPSVDETIRQNVDGKFYKGVIKIHPPEPIRPYLMKLDICKGRTAIHVSPGIVH